MKINGRTMSLDEAQALVAALVAAQDHRVSPRRLAALVLMAADLEEQTSSVDLDQANMPKGAS